MKKYIRLGCTVCKRITDREVDNTRFAPDKCTITLNCQGRLLPLEYRSNGEITNTPKVGITDWYPRNQTVTSSIAVSDATFVNTSTGATKQLVLAVELAAAPAPTDTATMELSVRADTPKSYRQYTFRFETTFQTVSGVETAIDKKTLRFTAYGGDPDLVEVFVNGVQVEQGVNPDQFQVYDGVTSPPTPNTIAFNSPVALPGTTQVDIIVSKTQALSTKYLSFFKNVDTPARTSTGSWENVDYFERLVGGVWKKFYLFTYDIKNTTDIDLNTILVPINQITIMPAATPVALTSAFFMLARAPYSTLDRYPDVVVPLSTLSTDRDYLKYSAVEGVDTLQVTQTALVAVYPPARLTKFDPEPTIKTPLPGITEQLVVDGGIIIGPDT